MHKQAGAVALLDLAAVALLGLETALMGLFAIGYVVYALLDSDFTGLGASLAAVAAIMAAGIGLFTWGFARRRRFALSGALTWQLMQASVGVWALAMRPAAGVALIASAGVVTAAVLRRQAAYGASSDADAGSDAP